jgi:hypothetical protein
MRARGGRRGARELSSASTIDRKAEGRTVATDRAWSEGPRSSSSLSSTAWTPRQELDLREWLEQGRRLGAVGRGVAWWIGDWLLYGNHRYGERYPRAVRATGYDVQSLMNMAYVASRFSFERRRAGLSWSHHAEVAALSVEEQERWLALAEQERMSVRSLRGEVQSLRRATNRTLEHGAPTPARDAIARVVCPECSRVIELDRSHARGADEDSLGG